MNKALNKYGKVSFKSMTPKRLKVKRVVRAAMISSIVAMGRSNLAAIMACHQTDKSAKSIAIAKSTIDTSKAVRKVMLRKDHPIHFEDLQ